MMLQCGLGPEFGFYVLEALPDPPVAEPFVLEPCCATAKEVVSIFAFLVCADVRLKVLEDMGSPGAVFGMASWTDDTAVRTQELGSLGRCSWWRWEVNVVVVNIIHSR